MELIDIEKKQVRFIIRQLEDLKSIVQDLHQSLQESDEKKLKAEIATILRKFRSGLFGSEERTEYKSARNFKVLEEAFIKIAGELDYSQNREISNLLNQARVYNAKLEKSGARGGLIEIALREARKNPKNKDKLKKAQELLEGAIQDDLAFEAAVNELMKASKKIKKLKSRIAGYQQIESMAIIVLDERIIILYDQNKFHKEQENEDILFGLHNPEREEARKILEKEWKLLKQKRRSVPDFSGFWSETIGYLENKMVDNVIVGYCEMSLKYSKEQFLGAYEIFRIATLPGRGLFFLELVLSWAALQHAPAILDRKEISPALRKLWEYIDTDKPYILKYPASLLKYPEAIGYTKKEVLELFGPTVILSSIFDENGFPAGLPNSVVESLKSKHGNPKLSLNKSYFKTESTPDTNRVIGGIASLDKAFYYDGEMSILSKLFKKGMTDKNTWTKKKFENAGRVFFRESKPRSGL